MTGLFDVPLGARAVIRQTRCEPLRSVRHGAISFKIDAVGEVGLVLNLSGSHRVEQATAGRVRTDTARTGSISVLPPDCPATFTIIGECRVLQLRLPWLDSAELQPKLNMDDSTLARLLVIAATAEREAADMVLAAISARLVARHAKGAVSPVTTIQAGGIAPVRLRRVLERMQADLPGPTPLAALATEAGLSLAHFSREFTRTMGISPHRYVVRRRVECAMQLLAHRHLSVDEVACRSGFTHASHLARHMRRVTGASPAAFRACVLP